MVHIVHVDQNGPIQEMCKVVDEEKASVRIRLPRELKQWLKRQALDHYRSLNNEIVARLEQSRAQTTTTRSTELPAERTILKE